MFLFSFQYTAWAAAPMTSWLHGRDKVYNLYYRECQDSGRSLIEKTFIFVSFPHWWQDSLGAVWLAACSVCQQTLPSRSAMDHLDCHFYLMLLYFSPPLFQRLKRTCKAVSASKKMDSGYGRRIKKERILNIIKHNICDSEECNGESNTPTNYLTSRSIWYFISWLSKWECGGYTTVHMISDFDQKLFTFLQLIRK